MILLPFQINDAAQIFSKISKLKPSALLEKAREAQDIVSISVEGKKENILAQTRKEVMERVKCAY